jgi:hypothetical protein
MYIYNTSAEKISLSIPDLKIFMQGNKKKGGGVLLIYTPSTCDYYIIFLQQTGNFS